MTTFDPAELDPAGPDQAGAGRAAPDPAGLDLASLDQAGADLADLGLSGLDPTGPDTTAPSPTGDADDPMTSDLEDLAQGIADQVASYLLAVREIARQGDRGTAVPLLLLEVSQLLLAGARLGVHEDFVPAEQFEPDAGPDPDLDEMRRRLATLLEGCDDFTEVFDPYTDPPELMHSRVSDDVADIAASVAHGLQHYRAGSVSEALWWWQFSYVSSWGPEASAVLRAMQSVIAHDRLDTDEIAESDASLLAAADEVEASLASDDV